MGEQEESQRLGRYAQIMERTFFRHYTQGAEEVTFERQDLASTAQELGIDVPKNLGDIPYMFRYRQGLPDRIRNTAPEGKEWVIRSVGRSRYQFMLGDTVDLSPARGLAQTKVPDATPGIVTMYAQSDEQGLLAKVRYNHLIDIFTGVTCSPVTRCKTTCAPRCPTLVR